MMNVMAPYLLKLVHINTIQLGVISSLYFYTNLILVFFCGILFDLFFPKRLIIFSLFISLLCFVVFVIHAQFITLILWRVTAGIAGAFSIAGTLKFIGRFSPKNKIGFLVGMVGFAATFAGVISQAPLAYLIQKMGYQLAMFFIIIYGLFVCYLLWLFIPLYKIEYNLHENIKKILFVLNNPHNWTVAIYDSLVNLPLFVLGALWGSLYLINVYGFNNTIAALIISMLFLGHMVGAPLFGSIIDRVNSRRILLSMGIVLMMLSLLSIIFKLFSSSLYILMFLFFILGASTGTQAISDSYLIMRNKESVGTISSLLSFVALIGGIIFQPLFGLVMHCHQNTTAGYNLALSLLVVTTGLSFIFSLFIPNKKS